MIFNVYNLKYIDANTIPSSGANLSKHSGEDHANLSKHSGEDHAI